MDMTMTNIESMSETELRELLQGAEQALERLIAKRARSTLKEAKRMAAEVGFEAVFSKVGKTDGGKTKPQSSRAKVLPKFQNPDNPEEVWSGRGRQPKWVQAALAEGQSLSDLAITRVRQRQPKARGRSPLLMGCCADTYHSAGQGDRSRQEAL